MLTFVKAAFAKSMVSKLANDNDTKTTILGLAASAVITSQIDFGKLLSGDSTEIGKAAGAVIAALIGYYTNKANKKPAA